MAVRFIEALRSAGMRVTNQRLAVCEFLAETKIHPTTTQVFNAVREEHPEISQATVYNTLNTLRDLGAIVEISAGTEHTRYEPDPSPHINLFCLRCNEVSDLQDCLSPDLLMDNIFQNNGFRATTLQVQVTGFCAACQQAKRQEMGRRLSRLAGQAEDTQANTQDGRGSTDGDT